MSADSARKCLVERQAADYLGYRPATLRQSRWSGKLAGAPAPPAIRLGRSIRYRVEDLDAWLEQHAEEVSA